MLLVRRHSTNPYFNIAAEEYFLKFFQDDLFMLWQNEPCLVVGKHQNTLAEVNTDFVDQQQIPVIRRISGGGTVYHDEGNLNFTFISNGEREKLVNFRRFVQPVADALRKLGLAATLGIRNDIRINDLKISGNAEHVHKNRVLHHGTLLFETNLENLEEAIKPGNASFIDKAVQSVRSRVTNIRDHLPVKMEMVEFRLFLETQIAGNFDNPGYYDLNQHDIQKIEQLVQKKYKTWEWNFGYSPVYTFSKSILTGDGKVNLQLEVRNGIIENAAIRPEFAVSAEIRLLENSLTGLRHTPDIFRDLSQNPDFAEIFKELRIRSLHN
mgnify:CR=1 FL=1